MSRYLKTVFIGLCFTLFSEIIHAGPWFTGPILAPAGRTVPRDHTNFEIYALEVLTDAQYDIHGKKLRIPTFRSQVWNPILTHGFTDWLDIQLSIPYAFNSTKNVDYHHIADTSVAAGIQLLNQKESKWLPNLRLVIQETFPTGKFDNLSLNLLGTDATGLGSYRTYIGLNFQHLIEVYDSHYLRTRLILSRLYSSPVSVQGLNSFGGTATTSGTVNLGAEDNFDLAFEYTLTQNWVAVMEGYISEGQSTRFNGILDIVNSGISGINSDKYLEIGLAPALEYNFTENVGVIGGVWFPVKGKNTSSFMTYVLALNAYW